MEATEIMKVLNKLEAPKANLGYKYIIESLLLLSEDENYFNKITALYATVAKKVSSSSSRVERAIRHEVELIFTNSNLKAVEEIFGTYRKNDKLPNKEFLASLYYYIYYLKEDN